jgi:hypothetical protein
VGKKAGFFRRLAMHLNMAEPLWETMGCLGLTPAQGIVMFSTEVLAMT